MPDPLGGFLFSVGVIGFANPIGFQKVSNLEGKMTPLVWEEITDMVTPVLLPNVTIFSPITLERGITESEELYEWYERIVRMGEQGRLADPSDRRTVIIQSEGKGFGVPKAVTAKHQITDPEGNVTGSTLSPRREKKSWVVFKAFPQSLRIGRWDSGQSSFLVESLVLANEGWKRFI